MGSRQVILLSLLNGYITFRLYQKTLAAVGRKSSNENIEHLQFIWTVRTAKVARQIFYEIEETYQSLVTGWGESYAQEVLSIRIHITEKNKKEAAAFRAEIRNSSLYMSKQVFFVRPKFNQILEDHTSDLIDYRQMSSTLVVFCGGPQLSGLLQEQKTTIELYLAALGHNSHLLDFISESYGAPKSGKQEVSGMDVQVAEGSSLWELVKEEAFSVVNTQRRKSLFNNDRYLTGESKEYATKKEMIEDYRLNGNILRQRKIKRV